MNMIAEMKDGDRASEDRQFHSKKGFLGSLGSKRTSLGTGGGQLLCPSLDKPNFKLSAYVTSSPT